MVDSTIQALLEQTIDTPSKLHLLLIFHENSRLEATARQLAERSCRNIWSVEQALQELVEGRILIAKAGVGDEVTYSYKPCAEKIEAIRKLIRFYDDPFQRDWIHTSVRELESYAAFNRKFGQQAYAF